MVEEITSI